MIGEPVLVVTAEVGGSPLPFRGSPDLGHSDAFVGDEAPRLHNVVADLAWSPSGSEVQYDRDGRSDGLPCDSVHQESVSVGRDRVLLSEIAL